MKKLIESTLVSLDGVAEGQEKWTAGFFDEEAKAHAYESLLDVDTFLLGRSTYEKFSSTWPNIKGDRYFDRINDLKKWVVSSTLDPAGAWNTTAIKGNAGTEIARLKSEPGKNVMKYGTTRLDRTLFDCRLVDELHLWYFPVVVGRGHRLFEDIDTSHIRFELTDIHRFNSGSVKHTYAVKYLKSKEL